MTGPAKRGGSRGSLLDRFLRLFTDVRPGEANTALLLALNVFILLTAYSVLKVLREPLIQAAPRGTELKSYSAAGQAILLVFLVPLYGVIARRVPRRRLINIVTAFFVACLLMFFVLRRMDVAIGVPFYIWLGVFNLMIIAQFWSFANDLYTIDEGKRLFPIVMLGGSIGAVVGSFVTGVLIKPLGLQPLFLLAAGMLLVAAAITTVVDQRERKRTEAVVPDSMSSGQLPAATPQIRSMTGEFKVPGEAYLTASGMQRAITREQIEQVRHTPVAPPPPPEVRGAFGMVLRNRYLLFLALLFLILNFVNTTGEYILGKTVSQVATTAAARNGADPELIIGSFYAGYQTTVNLLALVLQLLVVGRVIKLFGISRALLVLPVIAFGGYAMMAFVPLLGAIRWAKIAENATEYSLQNTVRQALFLPTTREEKYAAKQAIDGFFVRMGDVLSAVLVFFGSHYYLALGSLHFTIGPRHFALLNLALIVVWISLAFAIGRRYERLVAATP
jgi:AAA family ATP:ADP antiporter